MDKRRRLETVFAGQTPDRPPALGGWIAHPRALCEIAGAAEADYAADPRKVALEAYRRLDVDGLIGVFTTRDIDAYRNQDRDSYLKADIGQSFEEAVARVEALPDAEDYARELDFGGWYAGYRQDLIDTGALCGDMVYLPANWGAGARLSYYGEYGYENFFLLVGLRPDLAAKLCRRGGVWGRHCARLTAEAVKEGLHPRAVLLGEDICDQRGPMISVEFMREHYAPALRRGLQPLLDAGCRPVWHCDGDTRPLIPLLLECGVGGFQGFQPECGMRLEDLVERRTRDGGKLLIFGPLSVTTELPVLDPDGVRARVRHCADACRGKADLAFFTSNTVNPDVPVANIRAMHDEIGRYRY